MNSPVLLDCPRFDFHNFFQALPAEASAPFAPKEADPQGYYWASDQGQLPSHVIALRDFLGLPEEAIRLLEQDTPATDHIIAHSKVLGPFSSGAPSPSSDEEEKEQWEIGLGEEPGGSRKVYMLRSVRQTELMIGYAPEALFPANFEVICLSFLATTLFPFEPNLLSAGLGPFPEDINLDRELKFQGPWRFEIVSGSDTHTLQSSATAFLASHPQADTLWAICMQNSSTAMMVDAFSLVEAGGKRLGHPHSHFAIGLPLTPGTALGSPLHICFFWRDK